MVRFLHATHILNYKFWNWTGCTNIVVIKAIQWGTENRTFENQKHLKSEIFEGQISNGPVLKWSGFSYGYSPNHLKTRPFEVQTFLSRFQMVFDTMAAICPDSKWLGSQISEPIQNPDHLQPNLLLTFQNQTSPDFKFPLYSAAWYSNGCYGTDLL